MLKGFADRSLTVKQVEREFPFDLDFREGPRKKIGFSKKLVRDYKLNVKPSELHDKLRDIALNFIAQKSAPRPLDSRDKKRRFKQINMAAGGLGAVLEKLSVSEAQQLSALAGIADIAGFKNQVDIISLSAEQASHSLSKQSVEDRKDQAFYTMVWGMNNLLPKDFDRKIRVRFLVDCLDRLNFFDESLTELQKSRKTNDLLRKNKKIFGG